MDKIFGFDQVSPHDSSTELLTTVHDNVELSVLRSILEGENIPYMIRERGSGSSVRIIAGYTMFGTDIFVPSAVAQQARELLDAYRNGAADTEEPGEADGETVDKEPDENL